MNKIIDGYTAIVNGKTTGLAGCESALCQRSCLRRDRRLKVRMTVKEIDETGESADCRLNIPC